MKDTKKRLFKLVFTGILIGLMFAFSWTVLGMVPLGLASATTVFIPVAIGIICLDDFRYTSILGIGFGLVSLIRATSPSGPLDIFFLNPMVSVLPRFLMAIISHLCYRLLNKLIKNKVVTATITGGLVALFNTLFTIPSLILWNFTEMIELLSTDNMTISSFIGLIALSNMIPEIVLGALVSFAVIVVYKRKGFVTDKL